MDVFELTISSCLDFGQPIPLGRQEIVRYAGLQTFHAEQGPVKLLKTDGFAFTLPVGAG